MVVVVLVARLVMLVVTVEVVVRLGSGKNGSGVARVAKMVAILLLRVAIVVTMLIARSHVGCYVVTVEAVARLLLGYL